MRQLTLILTLILLAALPLQSTHARGHRDMDQHLANLANRFCTLPIYEQYKHQKRINTLAYPDAILFACRVGIHEPQTHSNPQGLTPQPVSLQ